jgi:hypothetical protein
MITTGYSWLAADANCSSEMMPPVGWAPDQETVITCPLRNPVVLEMLSAKFRLSTTPWSKYVRHKVSLAAKDEPLVDVTAAAVQAAGVALACAAVAP